MVGDKYLTHFDLFDSIYAKFLIFFFGVWGLSKDTFSLIRSGEDDLVSNESL